MTLLKLLPWRLTAVRSVSSPPKTKTRLLPVLEHTNGYDLKTFVFILGITHFLQVILFYHQYKVNRYYAGPGWWLLWSLAEMVAFSAMLFREVPGLLHTAVLVQNLALIGGTAFVYVGVCKFLGYRGRFRHVQVLYGVFAALLALLIYAADKIQPRSVLINLMLSLFSFMTVYRLNKNTITAVAGTVKFNAVIFVLHGLLFLYRGGAIAGGRPITSVFEPTLFNILPYVDALLVSLFWAYGFIIMTNQRLTAEVSEAKTRFETIFDTSPDAAVITRISDGMVVSVNTGFTTLSGFSREFCIGKTVLDLGVYHDETERNRLVRSLQTQGFFVNEEVQFKNGAGIIFTGLISGKLIMLNGELHALSIVRDITERKQAEDAIRELNRQLDSRVKERTAQLEESNRELEEFTYTVSHDLRSPLRAIAGFSSLLLSDEQERYSEDTRHLLRRIKANTLRMGKLIDGLLMFTQLGRKELFKTELDMNTLIAEGVKLLRELHPGRDILLNSEELQPARGDYALVQQSLQQIFANAVKFSLPDKPLEIAVTGYREGDEMVYCIADNGIGFDAKYSEKLFGVFTRLHDTEDDDGTGVGLAIVRRIMLKHGGRVWAEGNEGKGATIYFTLPAYPGTVTTPNSTAVN